MVDTEQLAASSVSKNSGSAVDVSNQNGIASQLPTVDDLTTTNTEHTCRLHVYYKKDHSDTYGQQHYTETCKYPDMTTIDKILNPEFLNFLQWESP